LGCEAADSAGRGEGQAVSAEVSAGPRGCCERVGHLCCAGCGRQAGAGVWTPAPSALVPVQRKRLTGC